MSGFFHTVLYEPIYNLLVFIVGIVPGGDIGIAVIAVTLIVRFAIMPLSLAALRTQRGVHAIQPKIKALREQYKDDKEKQARELFALYREHNINPLAGFAILFVQIPVLIGLYWVFRTEALPAVDTTILYPFISTPETATTLFLGIFLLSTPSLLLAGLAALTQFLQARYAMVLPTPPTEGEKPSLQEEFGRAMSVQARYILPLIIGVVAYTSGAIALYFITSSLFGLGEAVFRKQKDAKKSAA